MISRYFILAFALLLTAAPVTILAQDYRSEIALGQALFQDKNLSLDRTVACASCHEPAHGFADPRTVPRGVYERSGTRNAPSLLDLGEYQSFFWDGRAATLEQQASVPFLAPNELGFKNVNAVVARVRENPRYAAALEKLTGHEAQAIQFNAIAQALIAYERSLIAAPNALDRYVAGDKAALSVQARQGLALFQGRARCTECHLITATAAPLTDSRFHSSGVGLQAVSAKLGALATEAARLSPDERYSRIESDAKWAALGRYLVTLDPKDIGRFRTPSLRNVALTAPYMHDGSVATLAQAVDIELYYRGVKLGHPILLTAGERAELLAFLESLSSAQTAVSKQTLAGPRVRSDRNFSNSAVQRAMRSGHAQRNGGREKA